MELTGKTTHFGGIYTKLYLPWIPAFAGTTGVVVISVDEWERSKDYFIAVQEKTDFGQERVKIINMTREEIIRQIRHQTFRRSTLELELLLARLTDDETLSRFSDTELVELNSVLDLDDLELQKALLTRSPAPAGVRPELWEKLLAEVILKTPLAPATPDKD